MKTIKQLISLFIDRKSLLTALLLISTSFQAKAAPVCTSGAITITIPALSLTVGRETQVGDFIGNWFTSTQDNAWSCSATNDLSAKYIGIRGKSDNSVVSSTTVDGVTYNVYAFGRSVDGLGYIVRWQKLMNNGIGTWNELNDPQGQWHLPTNVFDIPANSSFDLGIRIGFRFIKINNNLTAGEYTGLGSLISVDPFQLDVNHFGVGSNQIRNYQQRGAKITAGGTCITDNFSVNLPPVSINDFSGVGSIATASETAFNLTLQDCPASLNSIRYSFSPQDGIADTANGVINVTSVNGASGFGIQIKDGDDNALRFNDWYDLTEYDRTTIKSYSIPMKAAIYQTESEIKAGDITGILNYTLEYK